MKNALIAAIVAAVVAAASGTAATIVVTSKNIKNGTIQTVDISAKAKRALKGNRGPRGFAGAAGLPGATGHVGPKGDKGDKGDKGETGDPWPLNNGQLPSGKTLRGVFAPAGTAAAAGHLAQEGISFGFVLPSDAVVHYIQIATTPPPGCPGTPTNPLAEPGHLCVYESHVSNVGLRCASNPVNNTCNVADLRGFSVSVLSQAAGHFWVQGSWAVTAP
jgi:Collagen triple helix repeat (20 copies)